MKILKSISKFHGEFYLNWKEYKDTEDNIFWYNKSLEKSTWENPLFIFRCLVENKINIVKLQRTKKG